MQKLPLALQSLPPSADSLNLCFFFLLDLPDSNKYCRQITSKCTAALFFTQLIVTIEAMRVVVQRVKSAAVHVAGKQIGSIDNGLLILLGIEVGDSQEDIQYLVHKIARMRIFSDKQGKMNLSLQDLLQARCLVVSQFTLFASLKRGQRPSFERAAPPEFARMMVEMFALALEKETNTRVEQGQFGADMQVSLVNDGPVTLILDSFIKDL